MGKHHQVSLFRTQTVEQKGEDCLWSRLNENTGLSMCVWRGTKYLWGEMLTRLENKKHLSKEKDRSLMYRMKEEWEGKGKKHIKRQKIRVLRGQRLILIILGEQTRASALRKNNQRCPERAGGGQHREFTESGQLQYLGCLACYEPGWGSGSQRPGSPTAQTPSSVESPCRRQVEKPKWSLCTKLSVYLDQCWIKQAKFR